MGKRYIYKPNTPRDDSYVVAEFVKIMPLLEQAHKCPVRLVKTKGGICRYAVYELIKTKGSNNERTCKGIGKDC